MKSPEGGGYFRLDMYRHGFFAIRNGLTNFKPNIYTLKPCLINVFNVNIKNI